MAELGKSRYPGIRSFEREEQHLFFGRDQEALELYSTIKVKPLTVLFAKSGIGKTSLLNAGVIPYLESDYFEPIKIRLQDTSNSPVETVKEVLKPYVDENKLQQFSKEGSDASLWEYIRACSIVREEETIIPVLIFDQFEEFFNHETEQQEELKQTFANLVNQRLPDDVQQRFRTIKRKDRTAADLDWYSPVDIRIVLAIRSDRMSALDDLKHYIPTILHDRFQLKALNATSAEKAIIVPAGIEDSAFASAPFIYASAAKQTMLETLSNEDGEIESFQLQLLCQYIERQITQSDAKNSRVVTENLFGGKEGIKTILNDYYEREISGLSAEDQIIARRFVEEGLIVNGRRVGLGAGVEQSSFNVSGKLLDQLLESRLIRAEQIHLGKIYELSHDTLVEPILKSYEKRKLKEERELAQKRLEAEKGRVAEADRKKKQARLLALLGFFLFFIALLGGILAYRNYIKSEDAKRAAERSELEARSAALASKSWNIYRTDHTFALRIAEAALKLDPENEEVIQTLTQMINLPSTSLYETVYQGHYFEVTDLAFSPDNGQLLSGSFDTDLILWDEAGQVVNRIKGKKNDPDAVGHGSSVTAVAYSPDGKSFFSGGADNRGLLWSAEGALIKEFSGHSYYVNDVAFSPDGTRILTGSRDKTARLWNLEGEELRVFNGHTSDISGVAFSPSGQQVLTGSFDGTARLWSLNGGLERIFSLAEARVLSVAFAPDGASVLLGASDGKAYLFSMNGSLMLVLEGHEAAVASVDFSPDGKLLATASWDWSAKLWDLEGQLLKTLKGHKEKLNVVKFSPDGKKVFTGGFDYLIKQWDIETNLFDYYNPWHTSSLTAVDISPDNQYILTGSRDNTAKLWDLSGHLVQTFQGHKNRVVSASFSPDGSKVLTSSWDQTAVIWGMDGQPEHVLDGYEAAVNHATYSPSGEFIVTADGRGETISLWTNNGVLERKWAAGGRSIQRVRFSPDGQQLVSCAYDGAIKVWDLNGTLLDSFNNDGIRVNFAAFDPNNQGYWTVGRERPVKFWSKDGAIAQTIFGHFNENYAIHFDPTGEQFVTSSWDQTAKVWNKDGTLIHTLIHPDGVLYARFFPNGEYLATACRDKYVRIWDREGELFTALGIVVEPIAFLNESKMASLSQIPFSISDFGLSEQMVGIIFNESPEELILQADNILNTAIDQAGKFEEGLENFDRAIKLYQLAANQLPDSSSTEVNELLATAHFEKANHLLVHRLFEDALDCVKSGIGYQASEYLQVYEVLLLLLNNQYDPAIKKGKLLADQETPEIEYYATFREAFSEEIYYLQSEFGIDHPNFEKFLTAM